MAAVRLYCARLVATCSWVGLLPAPGTMATLNAAAMHYLLRFFWRVPLGQLHVLHVLFLVSGFWASKIVSDALRDKDPSCVVIDEWAAMWLLCCFLPLNLTAYAIATALFRLFDICKPWPISWAERLPGAWGIMIDDYLAAGCTGLVLFLITHIF